MAQGTYGLNPRLKPTVQIHGLIVWSKSVAQASNLTAKHCIFR